MSTKTSIRPDMIHGSYILQRSEDQQTVRVKSTKYGSWVAPSAPSNRAPLIAQQQTPLPNWVSEYRLSFFAIFTNYFGPQNKGHFAIVARGGHGDANSDGIPDLDGRGFIIGNVSQYPHGPGGSGPAPHPSCAVIESFWPGGNAVYGECCSSPELSNGVRYHFDLRVRDSGYKERGRIIELRIEGGGEYYEHTMFDHLGKSKGDMAGFTILEVFSDHTWRVDITNLTETVL